MGGTRTLPFKQLDIITDAVTRTLSILNPLSHGAVVSWSTIENAAGFERYTRHWTQFLKRVRAAFLESRGIKLVAVNGVGLRLMTEEQQIMDQSRSRKALRQFTRGKKEIAAVPDDKLSDHLRTAKNVKIESMRKGRKAVLAAVRTGSKLMKPSDTGLPRVRPERKGKEVAKGA